MKWILAVAASVAVIGWLLPVKHHATRHAHFHQPPGSLYAVLAGPPDWRSDVKAPGPLPYHNGRKQWWEENSHGQRVTFELVEDSPPFRRVVKIADQRLSFGRIWSFEIATVPGGSDLGKSSANPPTGGLINSNGSLPSILPRRRLPHFLPVLRQIMHHGTARSVRRFKRRQVS